MANSAIDPELLFFNGLDPTTGDYLYEPATPEQLWEAGEKPPPPGNSDVLEQRAAAWKKTHPVVLSGELPAPRVLSSMAADAGDSNVLSNAGWGIIFPAAAPEKAVKDILNALDSLIRLRKEQAGDKYVEYSGAEKGVRPGESYDSFVSRFGLSPGSAVDPTKMPYYLLIVADPLSIPYRFQFELSVQFLVGRIYFERLQDYANYAQSVAAAESDKNVRLKRQALFWGPATPGDQATLLSSENLIKPVHTYAGAISEKRQLGWEAKLIPPAESTKDGLSAVLNGKGPAPAFLFTASHGMGWPLNHPNQLALQGALQTQDWKGPTSGPITEKVLFGAPDLASDANLLGTIAFLFACFGGGTPARDEFSFAVDKPTLQLAERPFLSALPLKMLSLPKGGALAVMAHVERAWGFSFLWKGAGQQVQAFKDILFTLMDGKTAGLALDFMHTRYANLSTTLTNSIQAGEDKKILGSYWLANNDARGYALLGDPAVRLPLAAKGGPATRPAISPVEVTGSLPPVLAAATVLGVGGGTTAAGAVSESGGEAPPAGGGKKKTAKPKKTTQTEAAAAAAAPTAAPAASFSLLDSLLALEQQVAQEQARAAEEGVVAFGDTGLLATIQNIVESLKNALSNLTQKMQEFTENVTTLEVATYTAEDVSSLDWKNLKASGATPRAFTQVRLDGDTVMVIPLKDGEPDRTLLEVHNGMVGQAQANRIAMVQAAMDILVQILKPGG